MSTPDDLTLMAYADGELDAPERQAERRAVEAALAADPALAAQVQRQRDLRRRLAAAFAPDVAEPVPDRLLQVLRASAATLAQTSAPAVAPALVRDLPGVRAVRPPSDAPAANDAPRERNGAGWSRWGGLAASLALGLVAGSLWTGRGGDAPAQLATGDGALRAVGPLAQALDSLPSGAAGPVAVTLSFVDRQGRYCRAFTASAQAGLACRDAHGWQVAALVAPASAASAAAAGAMRQAATALPAALLQVVDERIEGTALDAAAERRALQQRWQR